MTQSCSPELGLTCQDYWTQWTGNYNVLFEIGWIVIVPALLLTMVGSTVLGITLLVRGSAPRMPALLLALVIPLAWLILQTTSLGSAVLPVMFAFGILGHQLASGSAVANLPAAKTPARYCLDRSLQTPDPQACLADLEWASEQSVRLYQSRQARHKNVVRQGEQPLDQRQPAVVLRLALGVEPDRIGLTGRPSRGLSRRGRRRFGRRRRGRRGG